MSFANSLNGTIYIMKICGIWPPRNYNRCYLIKTLVMTILHLVCWLIQLIYLVANISNIEKFSAAAYVLAPYSSMLLKFENNIRYIENVKLIVRFMNEDIFKPFNTKQQQLFEAKKKFLYQMFSGYLFNGVVLCSVMLIMPAFQNEENNFPMKVWLPLDLDSDIFYYRLMYFFQIFIIYSACIAVVGVDIMAVAAMMFLGLQCDFLCNSFENLEEEARQNVRIKANKISQEMHNALRRCINQHTKILEYYC